MRIVEIRVTTATFGEKLGSIRVWLDHNNYRLLGFETKTEPDGMILIRMTFIDPDAADTLHHDLDVD